MKRLFAIVIPLLGCPSSDDDGGQDGTAADTFGSSGLGDDTAGCEPGSPGCPCANGMCLSPLVCLDDVCGWPGPAGTADPQDTGESSGGSDDGPIACSSNDDCEAESVCLQDGRCDHAWFAAYEMRVITWAPTNCSGGSFDGAADLWWSLSLGGATVGASPWVQGGCPGQWSATVVCIEAGGFFEPFVLNVYDEDNTESELFDQLWFDYGDGAPGLFPPEYLVAGTYDGATNGGGNVTIEFVIVEACE